MRQGKGSRSAINQLKSPRFSNDGATFTCSSAVGDCSDTGSRWAWKQQLIDNPWCCLASMFFVSLKNDSHLRFTNIRRQRRLLQNEPIVVYTSMSEDEVGRLYSPVSSAMRGFQMGEHLKAISHCNLDAIIEFKISRTIQNAACARR